MFGAVNRKGVRSYINVFGGNGDGAGWGGGGGGGVKRWVFRSMSGLVTQKGGGGYSGPTA